VHVALRGGAAVPAHRGAGIGGHSLAALVDEAQHELGGGVSALGERAPLAVGGVVVAALVGATAVVEAGPRGDGAEQDPERRQRGRAREVGDRATAG
jgi:hypothetical protein